MLRALGIRRHGWAINVRQEETLQRRLQPRPGLRGCGCREESTTLVGDKGSVEAPVIGREARPATTAILCLILCRSLAARDAQTAAGRPAWRAEGVASFVRPRQSSQMSATLVQASEVQGRRSLATSESALPHIWHVTAASRHVAQKPVPKAAAAKQVVHQTVGACAHRRQGSRRAPGAMPLQEPQNHQLWQSQPVRWLAWL